MRSIDDRAARAPFGKIKLTIEYDGTNFQGWQRQAPGIPTVQGYVEEALEKLLGEKTTIWGAGRTDSGVHAFGQVAHFIPTRDMTGFNLQHALLALLPHAIAVKKVEKVSPRFHSQISATSKTYVYRIWNSPVPSALWAKRSLWIRKPLNLERLNEAAQHFVGTHDFNALRSEGSRVPTTIRTINWAKWEQVGEFIEFSVNGSGFLRQMVRNLVGTQIQIEMGHRTMDSLKPLLESKDRKQAGPAVSPQGLYLKEVFYTPELDNEAQTL